VRTYVRTCVRTYVRGGSRSGMSRGMSLHTIDTGRPLQGYVRHTVWHIQTRLTQMLIADNSVHWRWSGAIAAWISILRTPNSSGSYSKGNTCHAHLTCTRPAAYITRARSQRTSARQRCACVFLVVVFNAAWQVMQTLAVKGATMSSA